MAKPPDCANCTKTATIHLTQIINNQIKKLDFCEDCPHQKGVTDPEGFSLAELLAQGPGVSLENQDACTSCGMTAMDFKKTGRLGCDSCYDTFDGMIESMLESMHRGKTHMGKVPEGMLARVTRKRELEQVRRNLAEAVDEERFEDAARFRDELRKIESTANSKDLPDQAD